MSLRNISVYFGVLLLGLTALTAVTFSYFIDLKVPYSYLLAISISCIVLMGIDKFQATKILTSKTSSDPSLANKVGNDKFKYRVPELVLYLGALLGGTLGIMTGMWLFRHKISKFKFILILFTIATIQIFLYFKATQWGYINARLLQDIFLEK